tara:strand:- start:95 stop:355 length:261 start_codon:yes stop_codon:yes gene_type:complete
MSSTNITSLSDEELTQELAKRELALSTSKGKEANVFLTMLIEKFGKVKKNKNGREFVGFDDKALSGHTLAGVKIGTSFYGCYIELV